jgi:hypothetical protein
MSNIILTFGDNCAGLNLPIQPEVLTHEFDRAFLAREVAFHRSVIDAVTRTLLPAIQNPELKSFVQGVAPAFQGHLAMAETPTRQYGAQASAGAEAARTGR